MRRLGDSTWEAVQPELGRRVALRRLEPGTSFDAALWPEGPGVVRFYAVTEADDGTYLATQLLPGARTLAECRRVRAGRRRRWVDAAAVVLAGAEHGRLTDRDILVDADRQVWLTGFGLAPEEPDREALERIRSAQQGRSWIAAGAAGGAVAVGAALALTLGTGGGPPSAAPPVVDGASAIGSALRAGELRTVDCDGDEPSGSSIICTVMQLRLGDRPLEAPFEGLVKAWSVRGASGRIALQILIRRNGGWIRFNGTRIVTADPDRAQTFATNRLAPKGARFGIEIEPGGAVGIRPGVAGAATGRFPGLLRRPPEQPDARGGEGEELLLRVDLVKRPG